MLCRNCKNCDVVKLRNNEEVFKCSVLDAWMKKEVIDCNQFDYKHTPGWWDMKEIAWELTPKPRGKAGFKPPERKEE